MLASRAMYRRGIAPSHFMLPIALGIAFLLAVVVIIRSGGPAQLDQLMPIGSRLHFHTYPTFDQEIVPQLLGAFLHLIGPQDPAGANTALRLVAALLYLVTAALLSTALLRSNPARAAMVLLLAASGYPFLWLSSELIAGALLCFAIWLVVTGRRPWLIGACLGLLALTKSELVVVSVVIGAICLLRRPEAARGLVVGFVVVVGVLVAPGLAAHGRAFFGDRAWFAFGQHYSALVANLQLGPHPDPWTDWPAYLAAKFPDAHSVLGVAHKYPNAYSSFVALSTVTGIWNAWTAFGLVLVAIAIRVALRSTGMRPVEKWLLAAMVVVIPQVLITFPHVRYMARLAPLVLMVPLAEIEARRDRWAILMGLLLAGYAGLAFWDRMANMTGFGWFPD